MAVLSVRRRTHPAKGPLRALGHAAILARFLRGLQPQVEDARVHASEVPADLSSRVFLGRGELNWLRVLDASRNLRDLRNTDFLFYM